MPSETEVVCPSCGERVPANFSECWQCQSKLEGAVPIVGPACSHCGATDERKAVPLRAVGHGPVLIGLRYEGAYLTSDLTGGNLEPLYAELCRRCGTVQRLFVAHADRPW